MKIAIVHFRLGDTDGVSLEIEKRAKILNELGHKAHYICGECPKDFKIKNKNNLSLVPELGLAKKRSIFMHTTSVKENSMNLPEEILVQWFSSEEHKIYQKFNRIFSDYKFDRVMIHNIFSNPLILPATSALIDVLDKYDIPTLNVNHDFYFEERGFLESPYKYIRNKVSTLPPKRSYITHNVINSLAQKELLKRRNIKAEIIGDVWDFDAVPQKRDAYNKDFRKTFKTSSNDLLVLQATRIAPRKGIENAILFCHKLEKELHRKSPVDILGKSFTKDSRVVLFLANGSNIEDPDFYNYLLKLQGFAKKLGVKIVRGFDRIKTNRKVVKSNGKKIYSFWDAYVDADLVTYPSTQEGFGNQLLEALYYKKLTVLFEYPVFKSDIKPDGYKYISLGDSSYKSNDFKFVGEQRIHDAVEQTLEIVSNNKLHKQIVDENFEIAKKHHGPKVLKKNLEKWLKADNF